MAEQQAGPASTMPPDRAAARIVRIGSSFTSDRAAAALKRGLEGRRAAPVPTVRLPEEPTEPEDVVDELKPGTKLLHGQYEIREFLNAGGFGITYLARDSLDRTVVIKECFPGAFCRRADTVVRPRSRGHHAEFRAVVRLFMQEARSLARLAHPGIVGVHQVFEDNDTAYMAIDYVVGRDLLDIIEAGDRRFSPAEVVAMLKTLLGAVSFIHDHGMLHRDISPDNILLDQTGRPVLIDFGAARDQASKRSRALSALRVVKDGYSPQEFYIAGGAQGPSSDLYALAATFHHLISGEAPPDSQRRLSAMAEGVDDPYRPLAGRFEGYPPGFLEAIDRAASVLPRDRIASARDWLAEIARAVPGGRISVPARITPRVATGGGALPRAPEPASRLAVIAASMLIGGGIVAAGFVGFLLIGPAILGGAVPVPAAAAPGAVLTTGIGLSGFDGSSGAGVSGVGQGAALAVAAPGQAEEG